MYYAFNMHAWMLIIYVPFKLPKQEEADKMIIPLCKSFFIEACTKHISISKSMSFIQILWTDGENNLVWFMSEA